MVALRSPRLRELTHDEGPVALRLLTDLATSRPICGCTVNRLLSELIPGGAKRDLSALRAKRLVATVKPRSLVGKTMRRMAAEEIADLVAVDAKLTAIKKELRTAVTARGSHLMDLFGVAAAGAARILADVGTWPGSPTATTSRPGPAPHPWTPRPGEQIRHRLSGPGTGG